MLPAAVRPPFDPEVRAALDRHADDLVTSMTPEQVLEIRDRPPARPDPTDADLSRGGRYDVRTVRVPGPAGAPDVPLVLCVPAAAGPAVPALYYVHGGGLVAGNARRDLPAVLDLGRAEGRRRPPVASCRWSTGWRRRRRTPAPSRTATPGCVWWPTHAGGLGAGPRGACSSRARAPGAGWPPRSPCSPGTAPGRPLAGQLLLCPMLDDRNDSVSSWQMAGVGVWDRTANETGWGPCSATWRAPTTSPPTPRRPAPRTCPGCRRPTSTSGPPTRSGTRTWPTPRASGPRAATPSCTSGPAAATASTGWPRARASRRTPSGAGAVAAAGAAA